MRTLPPAGTQIPGRDLLACLWRGGRAPDEEVLAKAVRAYLGVEHVLCLSQGRAALTVALKVLAADPKKRQVIVPSYTCYTVPASVVRAGLQVIPADIDPTTLDFDPISLERVDCSGVLAIVSTSLYGIPGDLARLEAFAERRGIRLIDDAAQAFGARSGNRYAGTFGQAGFFSLSRGKSITTGDGGILVTRDSALARALRDRIEATPVATPLHRTAEVLRLIALSVFLRPSLYGVPARLLKLGESRFEPDFSIQRYNAALSVLGALLVGRIDKINAERRSRAAALRALLPVDERIQVPMEPHGGHATYVRFPILISDSELRERVFLRLRELGLGVSTSYPESVPRIPGIQPYLASDVACPHGDRVARSILTLPTHSLVEGQDLARIADSIERCLR